jgi:hypothetical protein
LAGEKYPWNDVQLRIPSLAPSRLDHCSIIDIDYQLVVIKLLIFSPKANSKVLFIQSMGEL